MHDGTPGLEFWDVYVVAQLSGYLLPLAGLWLWLAHCSIVTGFTLVGLAVRRCPGMFLNVACYSNTFAPLSF